MRSNSARAACAPRSIAEMLGEGAVVLGHRRAHAVDQYQVSNFHRTEAPPELSRRPSAHPESGRVGTREEAIAARPFRPEPGDFARLKIPARSRASRGPSAQPTPPTLQ